MKKQQNKSEKIPLPLEIAFTYNILFINDSYNKIKRGISSVYDFILTMLKETTLVLRSTQTLPYQLSFKCYSLPNCERIEIFGQSGLTLFVNHKHELNHCSSIANKCWLGKSIGLRVVDYF